MKALAIAGFVLKSADPGALADFYVRAFGFSLQARSERFARLRLGATRLDIEPGTGRPYPDDVPGCSTLFQHFAIATAHMGASFERLRMAAFQAARPWPGASPGGEGCRLEAGGTDVGGGWTAISRDGPVTLPASSGGVSALKFRDPEGHPLELIQFPGDGSAARIDHSAISVAEHARSLAWYEALGFCIASRSLNRGPEQAALDGLADPVVDVVGLAPEQPAPHLELLAYRAPPVRRDPPPALDDIAATRIILACTDAPANSAPFQDPDGHWLQWEISPAAG